MAENEIRSSIFQLLLSHEWLLNASTLNYFKNEHWNKLSASWQNFLRDIDPCELTTLLRGRNKQSHSKRPWPLSLLALQAAVAHLSIPRQEGEECELFSKQRLSVCDQQQNTYTQHESHTNRKRRKVCLENVIAHQNSVNGESEEKCRPLLTTTCLTHPRLRQVFKKNVKLKKRHEIEKLAQVVASTAWDMNCKYVVDVGSGVGHLSRMLAYGYGLKVCCIEQQEILSSQGTQLDVELEKTISKHLSVEEIRRLTRPVRMNFTVDNELDHELLIQKMKTSFGIPSDTQVAFGIVGLHTCGDLAATLLRLFSMCPDAVFVNIVGCCYMKLTTSITDNSSCGYPMSAFHSTRIDLPPSILTYEALEVACHANEIYCQQLQGGKFCDQKVHCYRAALEEILSINWPELQDSNITSVKCTSQMTFPEYCAKALSKLHINVPDKDLHSLKTLQNLSEWQHVVIFAGLRLMLAPLVETVVLLDRLAYCRERGLKSALVPIFNPLLSPRNLVIIATKH